MFNPSLRRSLLFSLLLMSGIFSAQAEDLEAKFAETLTFAESGDLNAMFEVGQMYQFGMGVPESLADAVHWYDTAARNGHPGGAYQMGYAHYWGKGGLEKNYDKALEWFLIAAEQEERAAFPYLAKMYSMGQGVTANKEIASKWDTLAKHGPSNSLRRSMVSIH